MVGKTSITFKEALSKGIANKLDAEESVMNTWLEKTDFGEIRMAPGKVTYVPVIIEVKIWL